MYQFIPMKILRVDKTQGSLISGLSKADFNKIQYNAKYLFHSQQQVWSDF